MAQPVWTLLSVNLRGWISAKGFAMVVVASLFPLLLTGAWITTHQADVAATDLTWAPTPAVEGQNLTFTAAVTNLGKGAVGDFNSTVSVGQVLGTTLRAEATNVTTIPGLGPGEKTVAKLTWTARAGIFVALADADSADTVGELEEYNNQKPMAVVVNYKIPDASAAPKAPDNLVGDANVTGNDADAQVADLAIPDLKVRESSTFRASFVNHGPGTLTNATISVRVGRAFGPTLFAQQEDTRNVTLGPGQTATAEVLWPAQEGAYWAEAFIRAGDGARDPDGSNNRVIKSFAVQPSLPADFAFPQPAEKVTIKQFYLDILSLLHLRVLIPLIALFYAGGVLADDKEAGTLVYVLTRPVKRWTIPLAKFLAGYAVAATAIVIGIVATFALLFGTTPQGDIGFLTTPLLASLVALFAYGAFFILLGVVVDRPYLVGIAFVLGWETIAGLFVPWVENLTLSHYVIQAIQGWSLSDGLQWLPSSPDAVLGLEIVIAAGVVFLLAAAETMRKREFLV